MEGTELAKAYVQIVPSAQGISGGIKKALGGDSGADSIGKEIGSKLMSGIKTVIAGAAIGKVFKDALFTGAETEQLIGGIETLYGESADRMQEYAKQAYKNAGISANDYMSQATSFASSLLQSTGGNTEKAAAAANQAINDMADNANKFGTDLGSIQNAYQGFAKQNYTMLDNLKLGYGGTKTEMERLLADAEKLTGVKYDISNLSDVYSAIHAIQEDLGVTGTTAKEAASTFSGSLASMKASYTNLMSALFMGDDIGGAMRNLVDSAMTFFAGNLIPAIGRIAKEIPGALATAVVEGVPMFIDNLRMMLNSARNAILLSGDIESISFDAVEKFAVGLAQHVGLLWDSLKNLVIAAAGWLKTNYPVILEAGKELIGSLVTGIKNNFPILLSNAGQILQNIVTGILQRLPMILETGITLIGKLAAGLIQAIPTLLGKLPEIVQSIVGFFKSIDWGSVGRNIISGIANGLKAAGSQLWDAVKGVLGSFKENVLAFFGIHSPARWGVYVGNMIDSGIAGGLTGGAYLIDRALDALSAGMTSPISNMVRTQSSVAGTYNATGSAGTGRIIELLSMIAQKDTRIVLNEREVNRALREMGVAYI